MIDVRYYLREYLAGFVLIGLVILMSFLSPFFRSTANFMTVLVQASTYLIIACGMTFAIVCGEFDLSVGATMSLSGLVCIIAEPFIGQVGAIALALLSGILVGLFNGFLIYQIKISSFIVTIGTMNLVKGIALKVSHGKPVISQNSWFNDLGFGSFLSVPNIIWFALVFIMVFHFILSRTRFGRNVYLIGGNKEVSVNSGIKVRFHGHIVFMISGFTAAAAGVLLSSRLNAGSALFGDAAALSVISGVVIGGTSLSGGKGSILKSVVGILIVVLISNALDILKVFSYYQMVFRGCFVVAIIGFDAYSRYKESLRVRR
jgi:ribose transport system permease protein